MKLKSLVSLIAATAVSGPLAFGQLWEPDDPFTINGIVNPGDENLIGGLSATVEVTFTDATIDVVITNVSTFDSQITGFYLKRPAGELVGLNGEILTDSDPDDWALTTTLAESLKEFGGSHDINNYFGAESGTRLENEPPEDIGMFTFSYLVDDTFDASEYLVQGEPIIFVRWQGVNTDNLTDASGKGAWGPGFDPSVPEPSEVAALAMLGLGGILLARRRLTGKRK